MIQSSIRDFTPGRLAQLARAPARHAGGQRFKSSIAHSYWITTYGEPIIFFGGTGRDAWQNTGDFFMPKKRPEPFWRAERKCWFVQLGKRQVKLSPDETEAWRLYHELMAKPAGEPQPAVATGPSALVVEILDAFLEWTKTNQAK